MGDVARRGGDAVDGCGGRVARAGRGDVALEVDLALLKLGEGVADGAEEVDAVLGGREALGAGLVGKTEGFNWAAFGDEL